MLTGEGARQPCTALFPISKTDGKDHRLCFLFPPADKNLKQELEKSCLPSKRTFLSPFNLNAVERSIPLLSKGESQTFLPKSHKASQNKRNTPNPKILPPAVLAALHEKAFQKAWGYHVPFAQSLWAKRREPYSLAAKQHDGLRHHSPEPSDQDDLVVVPPSERKEKKERDERKDNV